MSFHDAQQEERRQQALQEAQQVLDSLPDESVLDGFNLLGVVANPRGFHHERTASGRSTHGTTAPAASTADQSSLDYTIHALETTLTQMTEQIDVVTHTLDSWSRHYLGSFEEENLEYVPPELDLTSILQQELSMEELQTQLTNLQSHLQECGGMAHEFTQHAPVAAAESSEDDDDGDDMQVVDETVAPLFFQPEFDLTDPSTFLSLLVQSNSGESEENTISDALSVPTSQILQLPPPDHLTPALDRVEVALLNQVRSKSSQFFHETNRFGLLKEWIASLVVECKRVRGLVQEVSQKSVAAWELIPLLDKKRRDLDSLENLLEQAYQVLQCKSSIGGLLSASQDLQAAEQIQYCQKLLQQEHLHRLHALQGVGEQLTQYQQVVVANLGEELVELFLDFSSPNDRIQDLVNGLQLCDALDATGTLYGNRLNNVIRMTVRTTVGEFAQDSSSTVKAGVLSMTFDRFMDCLDMLLLEQIMTLMTAATRVQDYCQLHACPELTRDVVSSAAELSTKSISELLRLRKEAHSLLSLDEMKRLWDVCMNFIGQFESLTNYKATGLRSTLLAQAKAFVERKHESHMSSLVAALDSERWTQCNVSAERQDALDRLCLGRAVLYTSSRRLNVEGTPKQQTPVAAGKKMSDAEVEGVRYKVVWSCLLLVEMVMTDMACAVHFKALAASLVGKIAELLRLFNSRATRLVLEAGAIQSAARLKSINAKHLSLVTQCVGMIIAILPHIRAALMAQLPAKQHMLLNDLDAIRKEYEEHNEKILDKFVNIIGQIVETKYASTIGNTNFDECAKEGLAPNNALRCVFLQGVSTNTRKMHQVLSTLLPPDHLQDIFSRIFCFLDQKIPELFIAATAAPTAGADGQKNKPPPFRMPCTDDGKKFMLMEVQQATGALNELPGVRPWEFTAVTVLEQELDYKLEQPRASGGEAVEVSSANADAAAPVVPQNELPTEQQYVQPTPEADEQSKPSADQQAGVVAHTNGHGETTLPVTTDNDHPPSETDPVSLVATDEGNDDSTVRANNPRNDDGGKTEFSEATNLPTDSNGDLTEGVPEQALKENGETIRKELHQPEDHVNGDR